MSAAPGAARGRVRVWDLAVRVLHLALAAGVATTWMTGGNAGALGQVHETAGYAVLAAVLARTVWGFASGSRYARFVQFVRGPRQTWVYALQVMSGREPRYVGHNPLGGWMVLALLGCAAGVAITGVLYTTEWLWGYAWLHDLHEALAWALLGLIALHVAGVAFTSWRHRESLLAAMVSGSKVAPQGDDVA